jgi:uncharacterized protein (TIGR04255 family)
MSSTMSTAPKPIPKKLKHDAIVEALFEIRFSSAMIPEIFVGRLADFSPWKGLQQNRLPASELPETIRQADANLRYAPIIELRDPKGARSIRIGAHVLSYHQLTPYVGWAAFKPELENVIHALFSRSEDTRIQRLGFRYVNAVTADHHGITQVGDLDLSISVAGDPVPDKVNLNFTVDLANEAHCTVRIATPHFISGKLPANTTAVIDVDVFTRDPLRAKMDDVAVKQWLDFAHDQEKNQFFRLFRHETIERLKES